MKILLNLLRPLLMAAFITACGGTPTPQSGTGSTGDKPPSDTLIQGTISGASFPTGVAVLGTRSDLSFTNRGTVTAPNTLNFTLSAAPESSTLFPLLETATCTFTGTTPPVIPEVSVWNGIVVISKSGDFMGHITETLSAGATGSGARVLRLYSSQAVTVRGTENCGTTITPLDLDVILKAGWNVLEYTSTTGTDRLRNLGSAARITLDGELFNPSVGVLLDHASLVFGSNTTVTVPATFVQIGGYSGKVTLSTDVPGLTVEPSSVTLSPLSTQNVALRHSAFDSMRQSLDTSLTFRYTGTDNLNGPFTLIVKDVAGATLGTGQGTIQTTRPGFTVYSSGFNLVLPANGNLKVPVCANSVLGFSGPITFSATNLPAGVSVTPSTVPLTTFACTEITLAATNSASGRATITLTGVSGSVKAQTTVEITVQGPAISASFPVDATRVYQGTDASVTVDVTALNGFTGSTTLTLSGLPSGITAAPTSVTVTPGGTTRATITLHATATAILGTATVKVNSPDFKQDLPYLPFTTLYVQPARFSVPSGQVVARASSGLWQVTDRTYYTSPGGPPASTLTLSSETGSTTRTVKLPIYVDHLVATSGGVLALSLSSTVAGYTVKDDGSVSALAGIPVTNNDRLTGSTDVRGRVWYTKESYNSSGNSVVTLHTWNPTTGAVTTPDVAGTTITMLPLALSGDGKYVLSSIPYSNTILKYATTTDTLTKLTLTESFSSAATSSDGTIWIANYGSRLARVNADGTLSLFNVNNGSLIGFDLQNPTILWGADSYVSTAVYRIDTATPSSTAINMGDGNTPTTLLRLAGGVYVETFEYQLSGPNLAFLSILK